MMTPFKVLWLSRHALGAEQVADLQSTLLAGGYAASELAVVALNATYPARSEDALAQLMQLCDEHGLDQPGNGGIKGCIAAVLPGHIAARVVSTRYLNGRNGRLPVGVYLPVSVPAPAAHGEARGGGFVHSHWEGI